MLLPSRLGLKRVIAVAVRHLGVGKIVGSSRLGLKSKKILRLDALWHPT